MGTRNLKICCLTIIAILISLTNTQAQDMVAIVFLGEGQDMISPILEKDLTKILPEAKVQFLDYDSPQSKQIIEQYNLRFLPFVVFSESVINNPNFMALVKEGIIEKAGNLFFVSPQRLKSYGFYIVGSEKSPNQLEIFTMSLDPRGQQALRELINLVKNEKLDIPLQVRYITTFREFGIDSAYGPQGIKEDIRQLIIQNDYPDKFLDYVLSRQVMPVEDALSTAGIDSEEIKEKEEAGLAMLRQDAQLAAAYGITSSPVFLWENQHLYFTWESFKPVILGLLEDQRVEARKKEEEENPKKNSWWMPSEY